MVKTCQLRVFFFTVIGVVIGNVAASHFALSKPLCVLIAGGGFWALANYANVTIFAEKGCKPIESLHSLR
ncbi:MAG: hypothetical protein ABR584_08890 [Candidatus Baltobacteraceae bacterium]